MDFEEVSRMITDITVRWLPERGIAGKKQRPAWQGADFHLT